MRQVSNRFLSNLSGCDSAILVRITNGTDSAASLNKLIFSNAKIKAVNIPVTGTDTIIQASVFCNLSLQHERKGEETELPVVIMPNPAISFIIVKTAVNLSFNIYSSDGILIIRSVTNQATDISRLKPGVYIITILIKNEVVRKMMIKR